MIKKPLTYSLVIPILSILACIFYQTTKTNSAPVIEQQSWGKITIKKGNQTTAYDGDVRIFPTKTEKWDWTKTGTHHNPGTQIADVADIVKDSDIIILTRGVDLVLQVPQETIDYVKQNGKIVFVGQTEEMVKLYNKLVQEGKSVGGLFHTTC